MYENQSDLLIRSFQIQSENAAKTILEEVIPHLNEEELNDENSNFLKRLSTYEVAEYRIVDLNGVIQKQGKLIERIQEGIFPEGERLKNILQEWDPNKGENLFQSKYHLELNESNFSTILTFPLESNNKRKLFLQVRLVLEGLQERLEQIIYFILISVGWGILFHLAFALFVYKVIFTRLNILKNAADKMRLGDFNARALWKFKRKDELDDLGETFNLMATSIQEYISTITRLNNEINQELITGKEVQEFFLPSIKKFSIFNLAILYRPMREVSGDIYYLYKNPTNNQYNFFLADASGHGVSAALITVTIVLFLEDILKIESQPDKIINELNKRISNRLESSFFASAILFTLEGNKLKICNGGHSPLLLYSSQEKEWKEIPGSGPPLGLVDEHNYELIEYEVYPGDRVLVYTDGITEALDPNGVMYGLMRLKLKLSELLQENPKAYNQEILKELHKDLESYQKEYKDDVTIMILEIPHL